MDLVALTWLGRGDGTLEDSSELRTEAGRAHNRRTAAYLLGIPLLADYLGEAIAQFGIECEGEEWVCRISVRDRSAVFSHDRYGLKAELCARICRAGSRRVKDHQSLQPIGIGCAACGKTLARSASFFPIETHARSLRDDRPRWLPNTVLPLRAWHDAARQTLSLRAVSFDFERSFQLPDNIEADKIEATFKKGRVVDDPAQECRSAKASKEDRGEGPADTQS